MHSEAEKLFDEEIAKVIEAHPEWVALTSPPTPNVDALVRLFGRRETAGGMVAVSMSGLEMAQADDLPAMVAKRVAQAVRVLKEGLAEDERRRTADV